MVMNTGDNSYTTTDRIEKTLHKYNKKDIIKNSLLGSSSGKGNSTRNGPLSMNTGGSINSISHVSKIYSSTSKGTG